MMKSRGRNQISYEILETVAKVTSTLLHRSSSDMSAVRMKGLWQEHLERRDEMLL